MQMITIINIFVIAEDPKALTQIGTEKSEIA